MTVLSFDMRRWLAQFVAFRERVKTRERQYGWLFPAIVPLCVGAVVFATLMIPVIAHWDAVEAIEDAGGRIAMTTGRLPLLDIPMAMLSVAKSVELTGSAADDDLLRMAGNLRGLEKIKLHGTRVTDDGIDRFQRNHPDVTITRR